MQNEWPKAAESIVNYREIARSAGYEPPPPIILTNVSCAESRNEARERALEWLGKKWQSIDDHYHFSDGHLAAVKSYESYGKMAKTYARLQSEAERARATEFYVKIQIVGTPQDCLEQIAELQRLTGTDHLVTEFSFGGIPHAEAERNMRLFADRVLPVLQRDGAFAAPPPPAAPPQSAAGDRSPRGIPTRRSQRRGGADRLFDRRCDPGRECGQPFDRHAVPLQRAVGAAHEAQIGTDARRPVELDHPVAVGLGHEAGEGVIAKDDGAIRLDAGEDLVVGPARR